MVNVGRNRQEQNTLESSGGDNGSEKDGVFSSVS